MPDEKNFEEIERLARERDYEELEQRRRRQSESESQYYNDMQRYHSAIESIESSLGMRIEDISRLKGIAAKYDFSDEAFEKFLNIRDPKDINFNVAQSFRDKKGTTLEKKASFEKAMFETAKKYNPWLAKWDLATVKRCSAVNIPQRPVGYDTVGQKALSTYQTELQAQKSEYHRAFVELSQILRRSAAEEPTQEDRSESSRELFEAFRSQFQQIDERTNGLSETEEIDVLGEILTPKKDGSPSPADNMLDLCLDYLQQYMDHLKEVHPAAEDPTRLPLTEEEKRTLEDRKHMLELVMRCNSGMTRYADMLDEACYGALTVPADSEQYEKGKTVHRVNASGKEPKLTKDAVKRQKKLGCDFLGYVPKTNEPLFQNGPKPEDVRQGQLGDCYFLSSLASIAAQNPAVIREAMRDNRDGTVTVRFYNSSKEPVYVTVDKSVPQLGKTVIDKETGEKRMDYKDAYARQSGGSLWVQLMEKAYTQSGLAVTGGLFRAERGSLNSAYGDIEAGQAQKTIPQILGTEHGILSGAYKSIGGRSWIEREGPYTSAELDLAKNLRQALDQGQFVTAGTPDIRTHVTGTALDQRHATIDGFDTEKTGLTKGHAYSVIGIEEENGKYYITVRNPHAEEGVNTDENGTLHSVDSELAQGYSRLELRDFNRYFEDVYVNTFDMTAANRERRAEASNIVRHYGESVRQITESLGNSDSIMMAFKNSKEFRNFRDAAGALNKLMQSPEPSEQKLNEGLEKLFTTAQKYSEYCEKDKKINPLKDSHRALARYQAAKIAQEMKPVYERNKDRTLKDKWDEFSYSAAEKKVNVPVKAEDLLKVYSASTNNAVVLLNHQTGPFADREARVKFYDSIRKFAENGGPQKLNNGAAAVQGEEQQFGYLQKNGSAVGIMCFIRQHLGEIAYSMQRDGYFNAHPGLKETLRTQAANRLPFEKVPVRQNVPQQALIRQEAIEVG